MRVNRPETTLGLGEHGVLRAGSWFVVLGLVATPALASDWEITPRVSVSAEVTDNVLLAPRGQEESDLIGTVRPGISLRRDGPTMDTRIDYSLNDRRYLNESREGRATHSLRARNDWEIVPDTLFLEARATRTENAASLLGPVGIGGSTPRDNLQETTRYSISPVLRTRYGSFANQEIRYTYDEIRYHRSDRNNSDAHRAEYTLDSGAAFNRPFWQLAAFYEKERYEDGVEGEFSQISATAGYRFGRSLRLFGTVGEEFNDYATTRDDDDGGFWEVGAGWAPTRVTNIEARYGERFFGKTRALSVDHRSRRASYRVSYNEGIGSTRDRRGAQFDVLAEQLGTTVDDLFDQFTLDEISLLLALAGLTDEALVEDYFFTQTWRASWRYDTGRSVFGVNAFQAQRESEIRSGFGLFEDNNRRTGVNASWQWRYGPRTTTELATGYTRTRFLGTDREDDRWYLRAGVTREITPDLSARLSYRHQRQDSDSAANEYRENSIIGTLTKEF
ncbi:TIGR03016 family PEP-CTERM system-associated outer membrane protein [Thioalkalivibrio sp. ALJ1]|uniref:TIGR03016 family PEP-CTERM system-associated outer membrane protein n=1 Tax=Thioalkalivibrio sp. ALJ1 TaxID=1158144 RepID=UPI00037EFB2B|nr:TIGR03016 family PEP-CTERM system-associated outer membrane protein [Thioalkalivibrio sp. ALJ1]